MNALVMGGTKFFGRDLVRCLLEERCRVTLATRGRTVDPFGADVERVVFDRTDCAIMADAFSSRRFDIVFDQIAFEPKEIEDACRVFHGRIGHYVFTSSGSVYAPQGPRLKEEDFDPAAIRLDDGREAPFDYAEGKRRAEAALVQRATFPVAAARLSIVLGPDDPTGRFQFHVDRVRRDEPIVVPRSCGRLSFVSAAEAGRFVAWLGLQGQTGAWNGASARPRSAAEIVQRISRVCRRSPRMLEEGDKRDRSPFCYTGDDWTLDAGKARRAGFRFGGFAQWFDAMVRASPSSA